MIKSNKPIIKLVKLNVNQWCFIFGTDEMHYANCQIIPMNGKYIFSSKENAVQCARECNIGIDFKNGEVYCIKFMV